LQTTRNAAFKAALLAGGAGIIALAQPAFAQDAGTPVPTKEPVTTAPGAEQTPNNEVTDQDANQTANNNGIVVTGSRIVRKDYTSNSPIVTVDKALLENSSTAAIEQDLNKLPQFVPAQTPTGGADIQPTATNSPGAATISLRGVGSNRNLVLIDGRRGTPSNASGVVDISTIPSAAIERVEVISGGASATYGADAVAGVTNFILKKNFQGLELDGQAGITQHGDGFEYQISGIMGSDFADGRGNVSIAMSTNKRQANFQRDRKWYSDQYNDPNFGGTAFFNSAPGYIPSYANPPSGAVLDQIFNNVPAGDPTASQALAAFALGTIYENPDQSVWGGTGFGARGLNYTFNEGPLNGFPWKKTAVGAISYNNTNLYEILPLTRYNMFARGNYEINDWIGVFGDALFSSVKTYTRNEPGPITTGWDVFIPAGTATYTGDATRGIPSSLNADGTTNAAYLQGGQYGLNCPTTGGCTISQVWPVGNQLTQILQSRADPNAPFAMTSYVPDDRQTFTEVETYNMTAGLQGSVPGSDWTWEAFVQRGETTNYAKQTGIYSLSRIRAVMDSPNFGYGFVQKGNAASNGFGASTGTCSTGLNFFNPPAGGFAEDCLEAARADLKNRSKTSQTIWEGDATGTLFDLPAGPLQAAVGLSYRKLTYSFDNDTLTTQGRSFLDQALGIYPSGNVHAGINTKELYGELSVPILKDTFIKELSLELGGRVSDYNTTGTSYTYKALANLAPTDWLRFRGGYNRAERAPNIGELYLSAQQTFGIDNRGDQCSRLNPSPFSANPATNAGGAAGAANVEAVCRALMNQAGPDAAARFYGAPQSPSSFGFAFPTLVGNPSLTPETANTWTAGVVISSPFQSAMLSRLRLSVDYYNITINHAIGAQSIGAVSQQCFDPAFNPLVSTDPVAAANSFSCQLLPRTPTGNEGNIYITYANTGKIALSGIDTQLDWSAPVGPGTLSLNAQFTYQLHFKLSALYPQLPLVDYAGTQSTGDNGTNGGVYRYKILANLGYTWGPVRIGLQWQHLPSIQDASEVVTPGGTPNTAPYPSYDLFNLSGGYQITDSVNLRAGVDNLFNKAPPLGSYNPNADPSLGQLRGGSYNGTFYDTNGRRFYIGADMKF
jgi:outer membrane receptor protein involved in Fe transport